MTVAHDGQRQILCPCNRGERVIPKARQCPDSGMAFCDNSKRRSLASGWLSSRQQSQPLTRAIAYRFKNGKIAHLGAKALLKMLSTAADINFLSSLLRYFVLPIADLETQGINSA